jgi:hypothetical protein
MYFNQKIIVINNRWGEARRFVFYTNNECLFFTWSNPIVVIFAASGGGDEGMCEFGEGQR